MRSEEITVHHKFELTLLLKFYVICVFKSQHLVAELVYIAKIMLLWCLSLHFLLPHGQGTSHAQDRVQL